MLPYNATDIVRLTKMEHDIELDQLAKRHPNGMPVSGPRKFSPFRFGRKRRQS